MHNKLPPIPGTLSGSGRDERNSGLSTDVDLVLVLVQSRVRVRVRVRVRLRGRVRVRVRGRVPVPARFVKPGHEGRVRIRGDANRRSR